jgi:hypothetical protein
VSYSIENSWSILLNLCGRIDDAAPLSPPHSPISDQAPSLEHFNPLSCNLYDTNSVVLSVGEVTIYLDKTLKSLGLHTEARTSFITSVHSSSHTHVSTDLSEHHRFWLPSFMKHEYVALRFLPQSAYEHSAPLDINPPPDVLTRIFMLYKGVRGECLQSDWPKAVARSKEEVTWWRDVIGVNVNRALDAQLYRVLEWGGMEVA